MTIQTFIVNYNYTFMFLHDHFGKSDVVDFWKQMGTEFCVDMRKAMDAKGLVGLYEYSYGEDGISSREHVHADIDYDADHFAEEIHDCPSPNEMGKRDKKRYRHYCEHCYWLYAPCYEENGFSYDVKYDLQEEGKVSDHCLITSFCRDKK
jgi:hypothetical protein